MIDFYVKCRRDKETGVEGVLETEIVAEIDFEVLCETMDDDDTYNLAMAIGRKLSDTPKVEIARIRGLTSARFVSETYKELADELREMAHAGGVMDLYGETFDAAIDTAAYLESFAEPQSRTPGNLRGNAEWFSRYFATHTILTMPGVNINALIPHMLAQLDMVRQDDGCTLFSLSLPVMGAAEQSAMAEQIENMSFDTIHCVDRTDGRGTKFSLIVGSVGFNSFEITDDLDFDGVFDLRSWAAEKHPDALAEADIADAEEEAAEAAIH